MTILDEYFSRTEFSPEQKNAITDFWKWFKERGSPYRIAKRLADEHGLDFDFVYNRIVRGASELELTQNPKKESLHKKAKRIAQSLNRNSYLGVYDFLRRGKTEAEAIEHFQEKESLYKKAKRIAQSLNRNSYLSVYVHLRRGKTEAEVIEHFQKKTDQHTNNSFLGDDEKKRREIIRQACDHLKIKYNTLWGRAKRAGMSVDAFSDFALNNLPPRTSPTLPYRKLHSPDEKEFIKKRLDELGISVHIARRRAKKKNLSLLEFLKSS